jgi:perosamine synthetase
MKFSTDNKKKILITGVSGMLGSNLAYYFRDEYHVIGLYNQHEIFIDRVEINKCDLANNNEIKAILKIYSPDIIIHCASLTDVEYCEINKTESYNVNVLATANLAKRTKESKFIYISTDSVYEGLKENYTESEVTENQMNYYGFTKHEGEKVVNKLRDSLILRTNIFGWNYQNKQSIGEWVVDNLSDNKAISGFKDVFFSSIYTMEFARIIDIAIKKNLSGIYNCASNDSLSKFDFAVKLAKKFGFDDSLIKSFSIEKFPFKAKRGKKLSLNIDKLKNKINYQIPDIEYSIDQFYRDYVSGVPLKIKKTTLNNYDKVSVIPYGRQWIDYSDISMVTDVLTSRMITQGPKVELFETSLKKYCNASYATVVNSGTSALHIACQAAGIKSGDEVITSPITFVASANSVVYCGGRPVFSDIDKKTYNLSPENLEKAINSKTKAVIPVHFAGQSCDMEIISNIVKDAERKYRHKIFVIEDACHALGSKYKDEMVGASAYSDMTVFSFHPVKHITTAEGGAILTNDKTLNDKLHLYRSHGIVNSLDKITDLDSAYEHSSDKGKIRKNWYYEQVDLGYNYRMTDIQSALGYSQMKKLRLFVKKRRQIVNIYNEAFKNIENIQIPYELNACKSNFHLYILLFDFKRIGLSRSEYITELKKKGILTQVHYIPVHTQPFYQKEFNTSWGDFPVAEEYYSKCLSIPLFPKMTKRDVQRVISSVISIKKK